MQKLFLSLHNVNVNIGRQHILKNINLDIREGQKWAITGASGSGKSVLAHTLCGRHFYTGNIETDFGSPEDLNKLVIVVEQQHRFKDIFNQSDFYYQQRYNSFDSERTITVDEDLAGYPTGEHAGGYTTNDLLGLLKIDVLLKKPLIQLSNGENKRLQLAKALMQKKELFILDQPFIGLDIAGRELLSEMLRQLSSKGVRIILITSPHKIPDYISHVVQLESGVVINTSTKDDFRVDEVRDRWPTMFNAENLCAVDPRKENDFETAVKMVDVNIAYSERKILQHINWEIKKGEKWGLSGPNGAGKSTLLSLITGDNPQAYANEIYLFDRRRGTGESIWDIKRKIGYISPELHLYFDFSSTARQAIASGLFDTIGLFRQLNDEQEKLVSDWLQLIGLADKKNKLLNQLSLGEQRFILLARALVKNPPLLILDEPCQGLDEMHVYLFNKMVDTFCNLYNTTLIYVSHYKEEIPGVVDRYLEIVQGEIVITY